jgi:hypothetical protein
MRSASCPVPRRTVPIVLGIEARSRRETQPTAVWALVNQTTHNAALHNWRSALCPKLIGPTLSLSSKTMHSFISPARVMNLLRFPRMTMIDFSFSLTLLDSATPAPSVPRRYPTPKRRGLGVFPLPVPNCVVDVTLAVFLASS